MIIGGIHLLWLEKFSPHIHLNVFSGSPSKLLYPISFYFFKNLSIQGNHLPEEFWQLHIFYSIPHCQIKEMVDCFGLNFLLTAHTYVFFFRERLLSFYSTTIKLEQYNITGSLIALMWNISNFSAFHEIYMQKLKFIRNFHMSRSEGLKMYNFCPNFLLHSYDELQWKHSLSQVIQRYQLYKR